MDAADGAVGRDALVVIGGPRLGDSSAPDAAYWRRLLGEEGYASAQAHSREVCAAAGDDHRQPGTPVPGLAAARRAAGLSQPALARRISVNQHSVSKYERGLMGARSDVLRRLSAVLGVPVERLTGAE